MTVSRGRIPGPSPSHTAFHPAPTRESFKDLLAFEERLKQNAQRLQQQRRKYEVFLFSIVSISAYFVYVVFISPSVYSLVHYINITILLISLMTLVLFFATGMYAEKIAYAYKFVPQANRALRPFNIYLNTRHRRRYLPSFVPFFRPSPSAPPTPKPSPPSPRSPRSRSPTSGTQPRGVPLAPIPPSTNPRGELIFSSRVPQQFREGYERYRGEWEKRREEQVTNSRTWWKWWQRRRTAPQSTGQTQHHSGDLEKRDRKSSGSRNSSPARKGRLRSSTSSANSSRSPSPDDQLREKAPGSVKRIPEKGGRVRAESLGNLLLKTMDEDAQEQDIVHVGS